MKNEVGLWIDHRKAVIVTIGDKGEEIRQIQSNMKKHVRYSGGSSQDSSSEDMRDRQFVNHLSNYYDGVISFIRDADSIWIFGPGEAKVEIEKRLVHEELDGRLVSIETVDKMTDHQIAAKVRDHFLR